MMAVRMVMFGSRVSRMVSYTVGADLARTDWHVICDQIQAVTRIANRVEMREFVLWKEFCPRAFLSYPVYRKNININDPTTIKVAPKTMRLVTFSAF